MDRSFREDLQALDVFANRIGIRLAHNVKPFKVPQGIFDFEQPAEDKRFYGRRLRKDHEYFFLNVRSHTVYLPWFVYEYAYGDKPRNDKCARRCLYAIIHEMAHLMLGCGNPSMDDEDDLAPWAVAVCKHLGFPTKEWVAWELGSMGLDEDAKLYPSLRDLAEKTNPKRVLFYRGKLRVYKMKPKVKSILYALSRYRDRSETW